MILPIPPLSIRLTYARLLEDHCATTALLRRREAKVVDLDRSENEVRQIIETLEADVRALKERLGGEIRGLSEPNGRPCSCSLSWYVIANVSRHFD